MVAGLAAASQVRVLHSAIRRELDEWRRIRPAAPVRHWARAVFALRTRGLQIDEEHEPSYQSENNPRYDAVRWPASGRTMSGQSARQRHAQHPLILLRAAGTICCLKCSRVNDHQAALRRRHARGAAPGNRHAFRCWFSA